MMIDTGEWLRALGKITNLEYMTEEEFERRFPKEMKECDLGFRFISDSIKLGGE
jgi:hypothetical protein